MGELRVRSKLNIIESCLVCPAREKGLLCRLPQGILAELNSQRQDCIYPRGAVLFVEGEAPRGLFILCSGEAKLSISSGSGHTLNLRVVEQGETLGLSSILGNEAYAVTAETLSQCQVSFISRLNFLQLIRAHPDLALNVSRHLSMELHKAYEQTRLLALAPGTQVKLALFLLHWAEKHGEVVTEGVRLAIHMTHGEIGESIGASRETVSRALGDFQRKHLIQISGGIIVILQPQQLLSLTTYSL